MNPVEYDVYVQRRGTSKPKKVGVFALAKNIPLEYEYEGQTFYFSTIDLSRKTITFNYDKPAEAVL